MKLNHLLFAAALCSSACHSVQDELLPPPPPEHSNALNISTERQAITQIRQTVNLPPDATFDATLTSLAQRNVRVAEVDRSSGQLVTEWIPMQDSVCRGHRLNAAPLTCRTRISVKVESIPVTASALNIRYQELCSYNEEITLECPDSKAERLLRSVADDVRAVDEATLPKGRFWSSNNPSGYE